MDRLGKCPNPECDQDWDGGEMIDHLLSLDIFGIKSVPEIANIAAIYGWTPQNKLHFSNVRVHTIEGNIILECPKCRLAWEESSDTEFEGLIEYKELMP